MSRKAGTLLWNRRRLTLPSGTTDIDTGLTQVSKMLVLEPPLGVDGITPPAPGTLPASRIMVMPLGEISKWFGVTHGEPYFNTVTQTVHVAFTCNSEGNINDLNVLFWDPHTTLGSGEAAPYNAAVPPLAPIVNSYSANSGRAGDSLQVFGANFTGVTGVTVNGVPATFTFINDGEVDITIPVSTDGPICVTTPDGTGCGPNWAYIFPRVDGYNPGSGLAGDPVTVFGEFFTGVTAVTVNGNAAPFTFISDTQIDITIPVGTTGPVCVTTPDGTGCGPAWLYSHWRTRTPAPIQRTNGFSFLLNNGLILVFGGTFGSDTSVPVAGSEICHLYDPVADLWFTTGSLNQRRQYGAAAILADGRVLIVGGFSGTGTLLATAEIYDPGTGLWTLTTGSLGATMGRIEMSCALLNSGLVLFAGGVSGNFSADQNSGYLFDPGTELFTLTAGPMANIHRAGVAVKVTSGDVMIVSGSSAGLGIGLVERYNPGLNTFSTAAPMITPRYGGNMSCALLPNGRIITVGGDDTSFVATAAVEIYDPVGDTWAVANPIAAPANNVQLTRLPSGEIFRSGGFNGSGGVRVTTEIYNQGTGLWTPSDNRTQANTPPGRYDLGFFTPLNFPTPASGQVFVITGITSVLGSQFGTPTVEQWRP